MQTGFIVPKNGRITKIAINGVECKIDPPILLSVGDVVDIPLQIEQDMEITSASADNVTLKITAPDECTNCHKKPLSGFLHFVGNEFLCADCVEKKYSPL